MDGQSPSRLDCSRHSKFSHGLTRIADVGFRSLFVLHGGSALRSHFKHSVELVDDNGEIVDQLAGVQDFMLAKATYDAAVRRWPKARIRLCQEARIVEDSSDAH
jgi:hypothetical protein